MKIEYSGCKDTQKNVKSKIFPLIFFANVYVHRICPKLKVFLGRGYSVSIWTNSGRTSSFSVCMVMSLK